MLAATTARSDARLATRAVRRFIVQIGTGAESSLARRRGLWRIGAAALAAGTSSVAFEVVLLLAKFEDAPAVRTDAQKMSVLDHEAIKASVYGGYLGERDRDALANFATFLGSVEPLLATPATAAAPGPSASP